MGLVVEFTSLRYTFVLAIGLVQSLPSSKTDAGVWTG